MRSPRRSTGAVAAVVALGLMVSGCAQEVPVANPAPAPVIAPPVIDATQQANILTEVGAALTAAEKERDPAALEARVTGPALAIRTSEIAVAKARKSDETVTPLPTEIESIMVPTTRTWPRTVLAVSIQPELLTQRLLVLDQDDAREPYKLWGWARLFPGTKLPTFATAATGSPQLGADGMDLKVSPDEAIDRYVDLLNKGKKSAFVNEFGPDMFREGVAELSKLQNEALKTAEGKQTMTFTAVPGGVRGLQSVEGGALILGELTAVEDRKAEVGAILSPSTPTEKALSKKLKIKNQMTIGYTTTVAIYIPPADSKDPVVVVGAEHLATSAQVPKKK